MRTRDLLLVSFVVFLIHVVALLIFSVVVALLFSVAVVIYFCSYVKACATLEVV